MARRGVRRQAERDWRRLTEEFSTESDRAAALVAAALLDENLESLLRAYMVSDQDEVEHLLGTSLQSLGARLRACYCLGLISHDEADDLRVIKTVRNHFAHNLHVSFDDPTVVKNCARFKLVHRVVPEGTELSPRRALEQTACMLSVLLVRRRLEIGPHRRLVRPELTDLEIESQCPLHSNDQNPATN